jgi:hypothetical protein
MKLFALQDCGHARKVSPRWMFINDKQSVNIESKENDNHHSWQVKRPIRKDDLLASLLRGC